MELTPRTEGLPPAVIAHAEALHIPQGFPSIAGRITRVWSAALMATPTLLARGCSLHSIRQESLLPVHPLRVWAFVLFSFLVLRFGEWG